MVWMQSLEICVWFFASKSMGKLSNIFDINDNRMWSRILIIYVKYWKDVILYIDKQNVIYDECSACHVNF